MRKKQGKEPSGSWFTTGWRPWAFITVFFLIVVITVFTAIISDSETDETRTPAQAKEQITKAKETSNITINPTDGFIISVMNSIIYVGVFMFLITFIRLFWNHRKI